MYIPEDDQLVMQSYLLHMATFWGTSLAVQRRCVSSIYLRKEQLLSYLYLFKYTFSFSLS